MPVEKENPRKAGMPELEITRQFNAPRKAVFAAFSKAENLASWWGPKGFDIEVHKLEFQPGGIFHYSMRTPDGSQMWGRFFYIEIEEPERIVFINSFSDEAGNVVRPPFEDPWPAEIMNVLTLTELEDTTILTLRGKPHNATPEESQTYADGFSSMQQGFGGTFDQLEEFLEESADSKR
jgi:uncharacterized protein YndB with AHSA1/START domain